MRDAQIAAVAVDLKLAHGSVSPLISPAYQVAVALMIQAETSVGRFYHSLLSEHLILAYDGASNNGR